MWPSRTSGLYRQNLHGDTPVKWLSIAAALCLLASSAHSEEIRVATASNFVRTMKALTEEFETEHEVTIVTGSTGKHYAQIINGAPFDIFFAADAERPQILETQLKAVPQTRFTYAIGQLALWSPDPDLIDASGAVLEQGDFRRLAIANPRHAPYGKAAQETLQALELWERFSKRYVRGENISQTMHFVQSGNAALGFVAYSQIQQPDKPSSGSFWKVPPELYSPIEQQAILVKDSPAARALLAFVASEAGQNIIQQFGYRTPEE